MRAFVFLTLISGFIALCLIQFNLSFNNKLTHENDSNYLLAFVLYGLYLVFVAFLSTVSFSGKKLPNEQKCDPLTGITSLGICVATCFGLEMCGIHIFDYIVNHLFDLSMAALVLTHAIGVCDYVRSLCTSKTAVNPLVRGEHWISTFYMGREVRPFLFGKLDVKLYANRVAVLTMALIDFSFLYQSLLWSWSQPTFVLHKSLIILTVIRIFYSLDALIFEYVFETSFEVQREGIGYQLVGYLIYPFLMVPAVHHVYFQKTELEEWKLVLMIITWIIGYVIARISNDQIYAFRKNPSSFSGAQVIPTNIEGKKLLCSGMWGVVRHPNHTGDLLIQIAFTCFTLWIPLLWLSVNVIFEVHRSYRNNRICQEKYGEAWNKYCSKVNYILVPGIF